MLKTLWFIIAMKCFTLGIMSLVLMLVFATSHETAYAVIALVGGFGGIGFAINLIENEVFSND